MCVRARPSLLIAKLAKMNLLFEFIDIFTFGKDIRLILNILENIRNYIRYYYELSEMFMFIWKVASAMLTKQLSYWTWNVLSILNTQKKQSIHLNSEWSFFFIKHKCLFSKIDLYIAKFTPFKKTTHLHRIIFSIQMRRITSYKSFLSWKINIFFNEV
jgi:hypothetical protein